MPTPWPLVPLAGFSSTGNSIADVLEEFCVGRVLTLLCPREVRTTTFTACPQPVAKSTVNTKFEFTRLGCLALPVSGLRSVAAAQNGLRNTRTAIARSVTGVWMLPKESKKVLLTVSSVVLSITAMVMRTGLFKDHCSGFSKRKVIV